MRPDSHTSAMFVAASGRRGFRNATFAAPVRCQYSESPTTKSRMFSPAGSTDDRRVTDLRAEPVDPVLALLRDRHPEEGVVVLLLGGSPGGEGSQREGRLERWVSLEIAWRVMSSCWGWRWDVLGSREPRGPG